MTFIAVLRLATRGVRRYRLRSCLTSLGITIGTASFIAMIGIGHGARLKVEDSLKSLDSSLLIAVATERRADGMPTAGALPESRGLSQEDYFAIRSDLRGIRASSLQVTTSINQAGARGRYIGAQVLGVGEAGLRLLGRKLEAGDGFSDLDVRRAASVCVLSAELAEQLFGARGAIGRAVSLNGAPFRVVGTSRPTFSGGRAESPGGRDQLILVPYTTANRRLGTHNSVVISVEAMSPELVDAIKQDIEEVLEKRRGSRTADFLVTSFAQAARAYLDGSRTMALLLGSVAGISLLVGGIGIMNMMLTNAAERSREIGVWLAIGTRRAAVQAQFLLEAALLSGVGSTVGVAFGATCAYVIASLNSWAFALSPLAVLVIICGGMGVGLVFGWLPARRAAQLDPIQVLRAS